MVNFKTERSLSASVSKLMACALNAVALPSLESTLSLPFPFAFLAALAWLDIPESMWLPAFLKKKELVCSQYGESIIGKTRGIDGD